MDGEEKIELTTSYIIRLVIFIALINTLLDQEWEIAFVSLLALVLTFTLPVLAKNYKIHLPVSFELMIVVFIYASVFLGEVRGYYTRFWWWDLVLHAGSGLALGFAGFLILYIVYRRHKIQASPLLIAFFSFAFASAIGVIWEIFEFTMDSLFDFTMQKSGLVDTMWDLIVNAGGALITSALGYLHLKRFGVYLFDKTVKMFVRMNLGRR